MFYLQFKQGAAENDAVVESVNQSGTNPSEDNKREANTPSATVLHQMFTRLPLYFLILYLVLLFLYFFYFF